METIFKKNDCKIEGLSLTRNYNKYTLAIKVGTFYTFDYTQTATQVHYHDCYEMVIILSGKGTFIYNEQSQILHMGDIFLSEPYVNHQIYIDPKDTLVLFYVFISIIQTNNNSSQILEEEILDNFIKLHHNSLCNQYQLNAYLSFFKEYAQNPKYRNDIWIFRVLEDLILNCLDLLTIKRLNEIPTNGKHDTSLYESALDYIDQNLGKKISADIISKEICTSRRNLYHLFQKNLGKSVHDYINERKISLAKNYLMMNLNVTEAARLVAIDNLSYFNKLFRKYNHISPREYMKEAIPNKGGYGRRHIADMNDLNDI